MAKSNIPPHPFKMEMTVPQFLQTDSSQQGMHPFLSNVGTMVTKNDLQCELIGDG